MITALEKNINKNTLLIDELISNFFLNNLKKNDVKTIITLNTSGSFTFEEKIKLFCSLITISNIDAAKFKVYAKINNDINNNDLLNPNYLSNMNNYYPFLMNTFAISSEASTTQEKLFSAIGLLSNDVVRLTKIYTVKPQIYYHKEVKSVFSC